MKRPAELRLSALIVLLALPVHAAGLWYPSIYRDPEVLLPQNWATDLVTLLVGVPLLVGTTLAMRRGSLRARVLWLGTLAFMAYDYGMYALAVRWNPLFLLYAALFGLSLYALVLGFIATDPVRLRAALARRLPVGPVATYLVVIAVVVAAMWLAEEIGALLRGTVPPSVSQFETPTNIVHVFDLSIVLPAMVVAAVMLVRDRPWGYVLAGTLLVKAATIGLWVVMMIWFSARAGFPSPAAYTAVFLLLSVVGWLLVWRFLALDAPFKPRWEDVMTRPGVTIFILFFGVAFLDALTDGRWPRIAFWATMGVAFLTLDWWGHRKHPTPR